MAYSTLVGKAKPDEMAKVKQVRMQVAFVFWVLDILSTVPCSKFDLHLSVFVFANIVQEYSVLQLQ